MFKKNLLLFALLGTQLFAQTLTLDSAIQKALSSHPDIQKASLVVHKNKRGVDLAEADYLPQVSLYAEYDPTKTYVLPSDGVFHTVDNDGYILSATLHQKIWDFSKTTANIDAQKENIDIAKLSLEDAKAYLAYQVKLQYELMLVQHSAIEVREKDLESKEALYKQALAEVQQGMKTSADATRFLSSFYVAKDNLAIAQANFEKARVSLSLYINEDIPEDVELEDTLQIRANTLNEQKIVQDSPSLKALKKGIQKSYLEHKSAKASHYGSVDGVASYSYQNTLNEYDSSLVGITLNIPLYSGGRTSAQVEQAEINRQSSQAEYNSKLLALRGQIESLLIDLQRYEKTIAAKNAQLDAAVSTYKLLDARYKEGLATYIEVLDALALQLDAKLGLLTAKYERSSAVHQLEYLQGKI